MKENKVCNIKLHPTNNMDCVSPKGIPPSYITQGCISPRKYFQNRHDRVPQEHTLEIHHVSYEKTW